MASPTANVSARRAQLLARLAAERAFLLLQLEGLDEDTLTHAPMAEGWTAAELLAHLAYWEAFNTDRFAKLLGGRRGEIRPVESPDALNAALHERFSQLSFADAVAISLKERRNFLTMLDRVPDNLLYRRARFGAGWRVSPYTWARRRYTHDAEHAADLVRSRASLPPNDPSIRAIHHALPRPILGLSRREFLALAALVPPAEHETRPLEGAWTLKQIVGHLVDYERLGIVAFKALAAGREPAYEATIPDFDAFNNERGAAWAGEPWNEVWANSVATRRVLLQLAEGLPDEALARPFTAPWLETTTGFGYLLDMAQHEREHADGLRRALGLPALPRRLGRAA